MDSLILEEVNEIIQWMKSEEGHPISVNRKFGLSVLNSLWTILTGHRFKHDDPQLTHMMDESMRYSPGIGTHCYMCASSRFFVRIFNELSEVGIVLFMPKLAEMFPRISGWNKMLQVIEPLLKFFEDAVKEHEDNPADEHHPRDFIDVYFNEIKKTTNPESSFYGAAGSKLESSQSRLE